jgi:PAS domain S-box-containing protein
MVDPEVIIKWCGAATSMGGVIWALLRPLLKTAKAIDTKLDVHGVSLKEMDGRVRRVEEQVHHNSGGSMRDSVARIETRLGQLHDDHTELAHRFERSEVRQGFLMAGQDIGYFECDRGANNLLVTPAFSRILGVQPADMMGQKWRLFMKPAAIDEYKHLWEDAFLYRYPLDCVLPMVRADGKDVWIHVRMDPVGPSDPERFLGVATEVDGADAYLACPSHLAEVRSRFCSEQQS